MSGSQIHNSQQSKWKQFWHRVVGTKRVCYRCHLPIKQRHRWHKVRRKFLFWTIETIEHRSCQHPELNPHNPYARVPFPDAGPAPKWIGERENESA